MRVTFPWTKQVGHRAVRMFSRRSALTLIEMIVALVLSAVLMFVLISVTRQTLSLRDDAIRFAEQLQGNELLSDQLRRDIMLSRSISVLPDGFLLSGNVHRDTRALLSTQQPASVRYRVIRSFSHSKSIPAESSDDVRPSDKGVGWLFRDQWRVDPRTGQWLEVSREPVWRGVSAMLVSSNLIGALSEIEEAELLSGDNVSAATDQMPETVQVRILDENGHIVLNETIHHHWEL
ncbi:hypothetical protein CA13_40370 [Planctomycetes bacterium CA13]|uniref:Type II secretion system protein J n=1 Tax=Novipirellula herctigrandis TaxID=2527986 RepID=A0A5C5Z5Q5_9BACT|nr:hypothetical protein CA13_40370 [Planctomycetes bacterium CA13]